MNQNTLQIAQERLYQKGRGQGAGGRRGFRAKGTARARARGIPSSI